MIPTRRPPKSTRPPKASVYAVTIHGRWALVMSRLLCMLGSATAMIVMSSTIISWVVMMLVRIAALFLVFPPLVAVDS